MRPQTMNFGFLEIDILEWCEEKKVGEGVDNVLWSSSQT